MDKDQTMATTSNQPEPGDIHIRELWIFFLALSAMAVMTILAGSILYVHYGQSFLERRHDYVGEVLMNEGKRLDEAGLYERALERYERALGARYAGPQNRTFTLKRAGHILIELGEQEKGIAYLENALRGAHADQGAYDPLVDVLLNLGRIDEAHRYNQEWITLLDTEATVAEHARARYHAGRIAQARGDVDTAIQWYEESNALSESSHSAVALAELYAGKGDSHRALHYIERYFYLGARSDKREKMVALRSQLLNNG